MKRACSIMAALAICASQIPVFAAGTAQSGAVSGIEVGIEKVYLSNMNFEVGDVVSIYADVVNRGDKPTEQAAVYIKNMVGCKNSENKNSAYVWAQTSVNSYGGTAKIAVPAITVTDDKVSFDIEYNFDADVDNANNTKHFECESLKNKIDLEITDIITSPEDFAAGDKINVSLAVKNNGQKSQQNAVISATAFGGGKSISASKTADIKGGGEFVINVGTLTAPAADFEISAEISAEEDKITDNNKKTVRKISFEIDDSYTYKRIAQASGGFIPGFFTDPVLGDVYAETDVGGFYRWNESSEEFEDMTIGADTNSCNAVLGVQAIYGQRDVMFYAGGNGLMDIRGYADGGDVFRTTDGGKTWKGLNFPTLIGTNIKYHSPIAIDQNNGDVLYVVSQNGQAYRTENATADVVSWEKIDLPNCTVTWLKGDDDQPANNLTSVVVSTAEKVGDRSKNVFIASGKDGVYISNDGGKTFALSEGSPKDVVNMTTDKNGTVYAVMYNKNLSRLYKYTGSEWKSLFRTYAPMKNVAVSPFDVGTIAISTENGVMVSTDGGTNFKSTGGKLTNSSQFNAGAPFWQCIGGLAFDLKNPKGLWFGDFYSVFKTDDFTASSVTFTGVGKGLEELCLTSVNAYATADRLATTTMDGAVCLKNADGYFDRWKSASPSTKHITTSLTMDYCRDEPDFAVFFGGTGWSQSPSNGAYTFDNGESWVDFDDNLKDADGNALAFWHCAVSKGLNENDNPTIVGVTRGKGLYRSDDLGENWSKVEIPDIGGSSWGKTLQICCAPNNNGVFYYYSVETGEFYKSVDDGKSFVKMCDLPCTDYAYMRALEDNDGYIAISLQKAGLWISKDGGESFYKADGITESVLLGTGKKKDESEFDTLFVYGNMGSKRGFFKSYDLGKSWTSIEGDYQYVDSQSITSIDGDKHRSDVLYLATSGRGLIQLTNADNKFLLHSDVSGISAVEITYRAKQAEDTAEKAFLCGNKSYAIKRPVLDMSENTAILDMELSVGENMITADENIEIVSAKIYTDSDRRYMGYELDTNAQNEDVYDFASKTTTKKWIGRASKTVTNKLSGESAATGKRGVVMKYYAPVDGVYQLSMYAGSEWGHRVHGYLNGVQVMNADGHYHNIGILHSGLPSYTTYSAVLEMKKGENEIFLSTNNGTSFTPNLYIDYVDIYELSTADVTAENDGRAAVEVRYKSKNNEGKPTVSDAGKALSTHEISFSCGGNTYKVKHPTLDKTEQTVVFDMNLDKGENTVLCNSVGIEIVSVSIYTKNARRYTGYELDGGIAVAKDANETPVPVGRANQKVTNLLDDESAATEKNGVVFKYYAKAAGTYKVTMSYGTEQWHLPVGAVNGKKKQISQWGSSTDNGNTPKLTTASWVWEMKEGENEIFLSAMNNSAYTTNLYINYVDIERVNTAEISEADGKVNVSATLYNPSAKDAEIALILAQYDSENRLIEIISERKTLRSGKFEAAEIKNVDLINGANARVFVWNMSTLEALN